MSKRCVICDSFNYRRCVTCIGSSEWLKNSCSITSNLCVDNASIFTIISEICGITRDCSSYKCIVCDRRINRDSHVVSFYPHVLKGI